MCGVGLGMGWNNEVRRHILCILSHTYAHILIEYLMSYSKKNVPGGTRHIQQFMTIISIFIVIYAYIYLSNNQLGYTYII